MPVGRMLVHKTLRRKSCVGHDDATLGRVVAYRPDAHHIQEIRAARAEALAFVFLARDAFAS